MQTQFDPGLIGNYLRLAEFFSQEKIKQILDLKIFEYHKFKDFFLQNFAFFWCRKNHGSYNLVIKLFLIQRILRIQKKCRPKKIWVQYKFGSKTI